MSEYQELCDALGILRAEGGLDVNCRYEGDDWFSIVDGPIGRTLIEDEYWLVSAWVDGCCAYYKLRED